MPEISKYFQVNSVGTAQLLEIIREENLPIKKLIVASSQVVYGEGAGRCPAHELVFPRVRPPEQLRTGDFSVRCPICGLQTTSVPTRETAPVGGETVLAELVSDALGIKLTPVLNGEFRPGEMRHLVSDTRLIHRTSERAREPGHS